MEISGKVHCFFEQSGTFKNEFRKLGYEAFDYDIQNNFGETDNVVDLFAEIENAYGGGYSIFDTITKDDLIVAFFPCINFCDAKTMIFKGVSIFQKKWSLGKIMDKNIEFARERQKFYELLLMLVSICAHRGLRLIIENPWNDSGETYLQRNFIKPTIIDKDRTLRGDVFVKPTAYWFVNCENTIGYSSQKDKEVKIVYKAKDNHKVETGTCSEARSMIHPDYARNFICDFIIGKKQTTQILTLF
jgi:hypothetical protein